MRKKAGSLVTIFVILLGGGFLTVVSNNGIRLLPPNPNPLAPEASVFAVAPGQSGPLVAIVLAALLVTVGMGIGLAITINMLDRMHRKFAIKETPSQTGVSTAQD